MGIVVCMKADLGLLQIKNRTTILSVINVI